MEATHAQNIGKPIKAVQVLKRFTLRHRPITIRSRSRQDLSPGHVSVLITIVLAVANGHAFGALKEVI